MLGVNLSWRFYENTRIGLGYEEVQISQTPKTQRCCYDNSCCKTANKKMQTTNCSSSWGKSMVKVWCKSMHRFKFWKSLSVWDPKNLKVFLWQQLWRASNPNLRNHRSSKSKSILKIWWKSTYGFRLWRSSKLHRVKVKDWMRVWPWRCTTRSW